MTDKRPCIARAAIAAGEVHWGPFADHAKAIEWANKQSFPVTILELADPWVNPTGQVDTSTL